MIDITPDLIIPYAEECTNDDRGARVENFTGLFATTRWIDLPRGSYQVCINYVNDGEDGEVSFLDEIMPTAQYDAAKLPAERTRTVFSLWMPYGCETAQLQVYRGLRQKTGHLHYRRTDRTHPRVGVCAAADGACVLRRTGLGDPVADPPGQISHPYPARAVYRHGAGGHRRVCLPCRWGSAT